MQRILLTGGTGFIGKAVLNQIQYKNYKCISLSRKKNKNYKNIFWIKCDISKIGNHINKIQKFKPNCIIFLSWDKIPNFGLDESSKNLYKSLIFFQKIIKIKSVKKIIVSGSCFEYQKKDKTNYEDSFELPTNYFSWAKISLFNAINIMCNERGISLIWFRIFYAYGKYQKKNSLIPYIIDSLKKNQNPRIKNFNAKLDFVYVKDIAKIFIKALNTNIPSGIYNLGSGKLTSIKKIYGIICYLLKKEKNIFKKSKEFKFKSSINKLKKYLSFKFTNINAGIKKIVSQSENY